MNKTTRVNSMLYRQNISPRRGIMGTFYKKKITHA